MGGADVAALVMAAFFAWSREAWRRGRGWPESARRSNFAALVSAHQDAAAGHGGPPSATLAMDRASDRVSDRASDRESVDADEHLAAYNAFLARINKPQDRRPRARPATRR